MADLLIIVPTLRRPANLERFLASFDATRQADTKVLAVAEHDDRSYDRLTLPPRCFLARTAPGTLTAKLNYHAVPAAAIYPAVGYFGDDCVFETPGWDTMILSALDRPGVSSASRIAAPSQC